MLVAVGVFLACPAAAHAQTADDFNPGADDWVEALHVQPDGKVIAAGRFTTIGGAARGYIARFNADGTLDAAFNPAAGGPVLALALQPDGRILVGGEFTVIGGVPRQHLARLNRDGTVDSTFTGGVNHDVWAIVVQPDGRIVVSGRFTQVTDAARTLPRIRIGRFNADGSIDASFRADAEQFTVFTLALQADGRILAGGPFGTINGQLSPHLARLNPDGSLDRSFNPNVDVYNSLWVSRILVQPDGRILIAGPFSRIGGARRMAIARLHPDGSLDTGFDPGIAEPDGAPPIVNAVTLQPDGRILVGGRFQLVGGGTGTTARNSIARINADGTVDMNFDPGANGDVISVAVQGTKALVGGNFSRIGGGGTGMTPRSRLARLTLGNLGPVILPVANQVSVDGATVTAFFTVVDPDSPVLAITATSSDTALLPNSAIAITGSGSTRSVTLTPAPQMFGTTTVTLTVSDGELSTSTTFTLTVASPAPANLRAVVRGNAITFTWLAAATAGVTGYQIEGGTIPGSTLQTVPAGLVTSVTLSAPPGVYYARVRAIVNGVPALASPEIRVAVGTAAAPDAPSNLLALVNGSRVHLAWENSETGGPRTALLLEAHTAGGGLLASLPLDPSAETFAAAAPAGTYSLRLRAVGPLHESAPSNAVLVTVPGSCTPPAPPRDLAASVVAGLLTITWTLGGAGTAAPSTFVIEGGSRPGLSDLGSLALAARSLRVGLPRGTYYARVRAVNACNQSSPATPDLTMTVP